MSKKDMDKLKRELKEEEQRFLASLPEEKRREVERAVELDVPEFLKHFKARHADEGKRG